MNALAQIIPDQPAPQMLVYDAACAAIAQALSIDEVLEINSRAEAIRAYAKQARNRELEIQATEIRIRALRRLGQLILAIKAEGSIEPTNNPKEIKDRRWKRILASKELGINHALAAKALKAADLTDEQYENLIGGWRKRCIEENKIYLTLERRLARSGPSSDDNPDRYVQPETVFDTYSTDPFYDDPIGDLPIHLVAEQIEETENALALAVREYNLRLLVLISIRDHFGGAISPRRDGAPILLREALSEAKLRDFIAEADGVAAGES